MKKVWHDQDWLENEIEIERLRWEIAHERAMDLIEDMGWTKEDDDYDFQIGQETKRQWREDLDRDMWKRGWHALEEEEWDDALIVEPDPPS